MARKKRGVRRTTRQTGSATRINIAWTNLKMFFILTFLSLIFYGISTNIFFRNFFGTLSAILGFITVAFLISWIVLVLVRRGR